MEYKEYILDRFEGAHAVCEVLAEPGRGESGRNVGEIEFVNIEASLLPKGAAEGSVIVFHGGEYSVDAEKTKERRDKLESRFKKLFK